MSRGARGHGRGAPIFILAAQPRSGTNYLWELLRRHPQCAPARSPVWEDYLLVHAPRLVEFTREAQSCWDPVWGNTRHLQPELLRCLGDGLVAFLSDDPSRRVVTKSPTIANLDLFFDLFPDACLLLLVRDGRDVAVSGMRTFGWPIEDAARNWARGTARILDFVASHREDRVRMVRFEDLVDELTVSLDALLRWLDLDPAAYDFAATADVPVRGSSHHVNEDGRVHWDPLPRPLGFRPIGRWTGWTPDEVETFERMAGAQLDLLGYPRAGAAGAVSVSA